MYMHYGRVGAIPTWRVDSLMINVSTVGAQCNQLTVTIHPSGFIYTHPQQDYMASRKLRTHNTLTDNRHGHY